jgi:hypothetical protein
VLADLDGVLPGADGPTLERATMTIKIACGEGTRYVKRCTGCDRWFYPKRAHAEFCSDACRMVAKRKPNKSEQRQLALRLRQLSVADFHKRRAAVLELPDDLAKVIQGGGEVEVVVTENRTIPNTPIPPEGLPARWQWKQNGDDPWEDLPEGADLAKLPPHGLLRIKPNGSGAAAAKPAARKRGAR